MQHQRIVNHLVAWLKSYAEQANSNGFVVGVSGGIDSALTSVLAAETGLTTRCLSLPIRQATNQLSRANQHLNWLVERYSKCTARTIDLTAAFGAFEAQLADGQHPKAALSMANLRSRMRMAALYHEATIGGLLVLGTGNKVEDFGVGFFTKYGDGGVDLSPIADLNKTEVRALANHLGIHSSILEAPPTDGLWGDDRTDEQQLGATYPELEWAMDFKGDETVLNERQLEVLSIYRKRNQANRHKMVPIPVCMVPAEWR